MTQYAATIPQVLNNIYSARDSQRAVWGGWSTAGGTLGQVAANTIIQTVQNDIGSLVSPTLDVAMVEFIRQMVSSSQTCKKPTIANTTTTGSTNVGSAVLSLGLKGPDGVTLDMVYPETVTVVCTNDSFVGGTLGQEGYSVTGAAAAQPGAYNWPQGSGVNTSLNATSGTVTTVLTDGNMEIWAGSPASLTNWTAVVGAYGTSLLQNTTTVQQGTYSLEFVGDGTTIHAVKQPITVAASTVYGFNAWVKASAAYTGGAIAISLVDGSGTVINDDAGGANTITAIAGAVSNTVWTNVSGFFITPKAPPTTVYLKLGCSSALANTKNLFWDNVSMRTPLRLYNSGPYMMVYSGLNSTVRGDFFQCAITNNASLTANGAFVLGFQRYFGIYDRGMKLPTSASPTLSDSLVA